MELMTMGLQALENLLHGSEAVTAQLGGVLDTLQASQPGDEAPITCEVYRCDF